MTASNSVWGQPPPHLTLAEDEIHVWRACLDQPTACLQQLLAKLSADERMRAERFYFEQDRKRFIVARGLLRTILSCYLGIEPSELEFCYGLRGKPALVNSGGSTLRFNLSHSQGLALYAIAPTREIGIDLEHIRPLPAAQIAERFFSAQENAILRTLPPDQQQQAFFSCWTRKEAFLKAIGDGLAFPLNQFDVSLSPDQPAQIHSIKGDSAAAANWFLQELKPAPGYVGALAVEGTGGCLSCWQWS